MPAASAKRCKCEATNDAKCLPKFGRNFGRIVTCCRAEPIGWILWPNFGFCRTSAHL